VSKKLLQEAIHADYYDSTRGKRRKAEKKRNQKKKGERE